MRLACNQGGISSASSTSDTVNLPIALTDEKLSAWAYDVTVAAEVTPVALSAFNSTTVTFTGSIAFYSYRYVAIGTA